MLKKIGSKKPHNFRRCNAKSLLDQKIDDLLKKLEAKKHERALLEETSNKIHAEMNNKAHNGLKLANGVLDAQQAIASLEMSTQLPILKITTIGSSQ